jgi:hypothetical protein
MKPNRYAVVVVIVSLLMLFAAGNRLRENLTDPKMKVADVGEGGTTELKAPSGKVITDVPFASYGTPIVNSKGVPKKGECHAEIGPEVSRRCVGQAKCELGAHNDWWGDPCGGTVKSLIVGYTVGDQEDIVAAASNDPYSAVRGPDGKLLDADGNAGGSNIMIYVGIFVGIVVLLMVGGYFVYARKQPAPAVAGRRS